MIENLDVSISEKDKIIISEINKYEKEYEENEARNRFLKTEIGHLIKKIDIQWLALTFYCLKIGKGYYSLKTALQVANCIADNFNIPLSREVKNNVATTLSNLFAKKKLGRIEINGKNYYGLPEYFNSDFETIKTKYKSYEKERMKNP